MSEHTKQKTIVIAGTGFAGIMAALHFKKQLCESDDASVVVVSKTDYHAFYPNLYEVATAEEEFASMSDLKKSLAIPVADILPKSFEFVHGEIASIDPDGRSMSVKLASGGERGIAFDYLLNAFGSTTDCFDIPGLERYGFQMKSITDALRIRNQAEFIVESHRMDVHKKNIRFIIGGGGFTGVELAGEFINLLNILAWKFGYPRQRLELMIVEGTDGLLPGLSPEVSARIRERFAESGVEMRFGNFITMVNDTQIVMSNKEVLNYGMLIWTGGVKCIALPYAKQIQLDKKGRMVTDGFLHVAGREHIFAAGDAACILDANKRPLPPNAQQAMEQGAYAARAILAQIRGEQIKPFATHDSNYIIAARGKWAALHLASGFTMFGLLPWIIKRFADLHYFMKLMPFDKALKLAWFDTRIYTEND